MLYMLSINNSSAYYVYKHWIYFYCICTLFNKHFDKIITTDSPKSHNPVKSVHFIQLYWHFCLLRIMLIAFAFLFNMLQIMLA